jgi:hypothetical protein
MSIVLFAGTEDPAWTNPAVMTTANTAEPIVAFRIMLHLLMLFFALSG